MIKKISILTAMALLLSSAAFAAATNDCALAAATTGLTLYGSKTTATATSALIGKNSTGVCVGLTTGSAGYAMLTQHINGTKAFGTTYDSTAMLSAEAVKGTVLLAKPTSSAIAGFTGTWSSM